MLLLLPFVHLIFLMSRDVMQTMDDSPEVWADEIAAFEQADSKTHLPDYPLVLVGGQHAILWKNLEDLLSPMPVLNRGVGKATVDDIHHYYQRLIGFYQPHIVVFVPEDSEFHIRDFKSADDLFRGIRKLVELDLSYGITQHFYVVTPIRSVLFPDDNEKIDETTQLLQSWAATDERVTILDPNPLLTNSNGKANPAYYRSDGVHLNDRGYVRLSMLLRAQVEQDNPGLFDLAAAQ